MEERQTDRYESLHRIYDKLQVLFNVNVGEVPESTIVDYDHLLDRLSGFGEDIKEFRFSPADWRPARLTQTGGGFATYNIGPLNGNEKLVIAHSVYQDQVKRAWRFVYRLLEKEKRSMQNSDQNIAKIDKRTSILATIVSAYLTNEQEIRVLAAGNSHMFKHPALPQGFEPEWSHIRALGDEGELNLHSVGRNWTITIPTNVLRRFQDPSITQKLQSGDSAKEEQALQQVFNIVNGGVGNFSIAGGDATQNVNLGVSANDVESLLRTLSELQVPPLYLDQLKSSLEEVDDQTSRIQLAWAWLVRFTTDAGSGAAGAALVSVVPEVMRAVSSFAGTIL